MGSSLHAAGSEARNLLNPVRASSRLTCQYDWTVHFLQAFKSVENASRTDTAMAAGEPKTCDLDAVDMYQLC